MSNHQQAQYGGGYGGAPPQQQSYGGYAPPGGPPPGQQGFAPSPGPPPSQQGYGYPQQGYGAPPPQAPYGAPPQQQPYGAPPQQQPYGAPPQQQPYGAPPGQPPYGAPPAQHYSAPPQQPYQHPSQPSPGYNPTFISPVDTSRDAEGLRSAMKGIGTNEAQLIQILTRIHDPYVMASVQQTYNRLFRRNLLEDINKETGSYFCEGLEAIIRGPLRQDAHNLNDAIKGLGTKENTLNDVLLARSNADMAAIKAEYQRVYRRSLEADVRGDLSLKTERLFMMVLSAHRAEDSAPVNPQELERDVSELHRATEGTRLGTDQMTVCQIFSSRSDGQLRAVAQEYQRRYARPLSKSIEKEFSGHMQDALLRMLGAAEDRAMSDAVALEETMKGAGTKDRLLLNRLVRLQWNRAHLGQVKGAYKAKFGKDLAAGIRSETSGDFRKLLLAILEGF